MKQIYILIGILLLVVSGTLIAEQAILIDFSDLGADYPPGNPTDNSRTLTDFSKIAGSTFSEDELLLMKTSLALNKWEIDLASSARTVINQENSYTREATVSSKAKDFKGEQIAGKKVLGIRVHFPDMPFNSYAIVRPPFEIPAYSDKDELQSDGTLLVPDDNKGRGDKFDNIGITKNIGILHSISISVYGSNFPHGLAVILRNQNNEDRIYYMASLQFDGWRTLLWENPNYVTEVRNREIQMYPLYPKSKPFYKLVGLVVYKDAAFEGGDFITYVKDIRVTYDKAVLDIERDIDDEQVWGILQERESNRRAAELRRLGNLQILRYLEEKKMHNPLSTSATLPPAATGTQ